MTLLAIVFLSASAARAVELESVSIFGTSGNAASSGVAVNANGEFVTFWSDANNLVVHDTNEVRDVFVRDRTAAATERVDLSSTGEQTNLPSHAQGGAPAISGDGGIVTFYSSATNLVPGVNGRPDVFVRANGTTELVSMSTDGKQGDGPSLYPSISANAMLVAFQSQASNFADGTGNVANIFVRDRTSGTTVLLCGKPGNNGSFTPAISADGTVVAFASAATNLGPPDTNNHIDVFVCDHGAVELVSVSSAGVQGDGDSILPAISQDGRFVAFKSSADNLVPHDTNGVVDVFVRDRVLGTTERVSVNYVDGGNADDASFPPSISYDGRFVAFGSAATNLVRGDSNGVPDVFVRDRLTMLTLLVDVNDQGKQANMGTPDIPPGISGDGKQVGFVSLATNLVDNDHNEQVDVFIGRNPFSCDAQHPCPTGLVCNEGTGFCEVPPPTPTPTPTPLECCQCEGSCAAAQMGMCAANCTLVSSAVCLSSGHCATFTPTLTPTPTPPACCQCEGTCALPTMGACPTNCTLVSSAVCLSSGNCATITPTLTPTPTPLACCQCEGTCALPTMGACPTNCTLVSSAVCLSSGNCATVTPTVTPTSRTGTPTNTHAATATNTPANTPINSRTPSNTPAQTPTRTPTLAQSLDSDACNCTVTPTPNGGGRRVLLWLAGPLAFLWLRRRSRN